MDGKLSSAKVIEAIAGVFQGSARALAAGETTETVEAAEAAP
jgi:hypothetical protein